MNINNIKITIIGAGNGGQAFAGHLGILGCKVCLYNRSFSKLEAIKSKGGIELVGEIKGFGRIDLITTNLEEAVAYANIILIATTANAHRELAEKMCPYLQKDQIIILNPGRTGGVLEFNSILENCKNTIHVYVAEAQTLVYACRIIENGIVHIIGVKEKVLLSGLNKYETEFILNNITPLFPCFIPAKNVLQTSLENIGAIFHPTVVLFNAAAIERGNKFFFYRDMTKQVSQFILEIDQERVNVGKAYGIDLISAVDWISFAYPNTKGCTICEKMQNNPAYYDILAPNSIYSRQITEDIPTGLIPISELGRIANVNVDLMLSVITICGSLLGIDFYKNSRTLEQMGLKNKTFNDIKENL